MSSYGPAGGRPARRRGRRAGGNDSLHDVRARLKISSHKLPWQGSCCTIAQARMHELWRYIYTCVHMHIYTNMCMYIYMHMCIYIYSCIYVCVCACMYTYVYVRMYTSIYVHVYMYMYMYIYESICNFSKSMHAFTGVVEHHACAGVYVRQML